jgi:hypothetical protein
MASTPLKTKKTKPTTKRAPTVKSVAVKEGELVIVTWMDACATVGWEDHREAKLKVAHCRSIGWVGRSTDASKYMLLYSDKAHDDTEDHDSNRRIAIPSGWITGIKKVKE